MDLDRLQRLTLEGDFQAGEELRRWRKRRGEYPAIFIPYCQVIGEALAYGKSFHRFVEQFVSSTGLGEVVWLSWELPLPRDVTPTTTITSTVLELDAALAAVTSSELTISSRTLRNDRRTPRERLAQDTVAWLRGRERRGKEGWMPVPPRHRTRRRRR